MTNRNILNRFRSSLGLLLASIVFLAVAPLQAATPFPCSTNELLRITSTNATTFAFNSTPVPMFGHTGLGIWVSAAESSGDTTGTNTFTLTWQTSLDNVTWANNWTMTNTIATSLGTNRYLWFTNIATTVLDNANWARVNLVSNKGTNDLSLIVTSSAFP